MLPQHILRLDPKLKVVGRLERLRSDQPSEQAEHKQISEGDIDRLLADSLEVLEDLLRESGHIGRDSKLMLLSEPGKQVKKIDLLLAEIAPDNDFRRLVIVEDKLIKNSEQRRQVLAQVLEYAHVIQSRLSPNDLPDQVRGVNITDWIDDNREELSRSMRSGNYLLVLCGDVIHRRLLKLIHSYVARVSPATHSDLVMVALAIYRDNETSVLVPHLVGETTRAPRNLTIELEVRAPNGIPLEAFNVMVTEKADKQNTGPNERVEPSEFWQVFKSKHGQRSVDAWNKLRSEIEALGIPSVSLDHFPESGAPFFGASTGSYGRIAVLRLSTTPFVRDKLNTQLWDATELQPIRESFRQHLLTSVPGVTLGKAGRVVIPLRVAADHAQTIAQALSSFVANLNNRPGETRA